MSELEIFETQKLFYKNNLLAWKSLNVITQNSLIKNYPDLFPITKDNRYKKHSWKSYYKECWKLTESIKHLIPDIELRAFNKYDIDHIVPVYYGFIRNINPQLIASLDNLRIIPSKENSKKSTKLIDESYILLDSWNITYKKNTSKKW